MRATRRRWTRRCARRAWRCRNRSGDKPKVNVNGIEELVTDKGYHSGAVVQRVKSYEVRSYIPEKQQKGQRNWAGKQAEQQAVYANRRRVRGEYGKSLLRRRGEFVERSFAHCYETGGMRRCHLRGRDNILKRQLVHVGAFNLSLVLRQLLGAGTPRELRNRLGTCILHVFLLLSRWNAHHRSCRSRIGAAEARHVARSRARQCRTSCRKSAGSTTDCYGIAGTETPGSRIRDRSKTAWAIRSTPIHLQRCTVEPRLSRIVLAKSTRMMPNFAKGDRCRKPRKSLTKSMTSPHQVCRCSSFDLQSSPTV